MRVPTSSKTMPLNATLWRLASAIVSILAMFVTCVTIATSVTQAAPHEEGACCCVLHQYESAQPSAGARVATSDEKPRIPARGLAAKKPGGELELFDFERAPLGDYDVLIDVWYCGVCHTDVHSVDGDHGAPGDLSAFPMVSGHEVVGQVREVGAKVTKHRPGDMVGVGPFKAACGVCEFCRKGEEQYCPHAMFTNHYGGGFANNIVAQEEFAFKIPDGVPLEQVAPLLCAGITTYTPIKLAGVRAGDRCAVVGFGGLGDMAVKFLLAKGAKVTIFDINETKSARAKELGCEFISAADEETKATLASQFDFILTTVPARYEIQPYVNMLRPGGKLYCVGAPNAPTSLHLVSLLPHRTLCGTMSGSNADYAEMLQYCAENRIFSDVRTISYEEINEVFRKLREGTGKFRYVLDVRTLPKREKP
ncbi:MAG: NAD(P)-dependent alcohol dehydrogenase [Planctomycetia bacterium]|nr:NAD(P)-dependent alcohol dehydrogenase [Planctomycetia bacterium]